MPTDRAATTVDDADIDEALEAVVAAARAHLATLRAAAERGDGHGDDDLIWAAYVALNNASVRYDDLIADAFDEVTPWDVEFVDADGDLARGSTVLTAAEPEGPGQPLVSTVISVRQRRDYLVPDVAALLRAGALARQAVWAGTDAEAAADPVETVGEAVYELVHAGGGGLDALDVTELEPAGGVLVVDRIAAPLVLHADDEGPGDEDGSSVFVLGPEAEQLYRLDEIMVDDHEDPDGA